MLEAVAPRDAHTWYKAMLAHSQTCLFLGGALSIICVCIYIYICMYICTYKYIRVCTYVICMCIYRHTYIYKICVVRWVSLSLHPKKRGRYRRKLPLENEANEDDLVRGGWGLGLVSVV